MQTSSVYAGTKSSKRYELLQTIDKQFYRTMYWFLCVTVTVGYSMAFNPTIVPSEGRNDVPWANDYLSEYPDRVGEVRTVTSVKFRPKGVIIETVGWCAFLYKSIPEHNEIKTYVELWSSSKQVSPLLQAQLTESLPYFILGEDTEREGVWKAEKGYYYQSSPSAKATPETKLNLTLPSPAYSVQDAHEEGGEKLAAAHRKQTAKKRPLEEATNSTKPLA